MPLDGVQVLGLRELRRDIRRLEPEYLPVFRNAMKRAGQVVVRDAQSRVRRDATRSGRSKGNAADSLRIVAGGNTIYIAGGKASVPYFGWLDFGGTLRPVGRRRNTQRRPILKKGRYLYPAIDATRPQLIASAAEAMDDTIRKLDL